MVHVIPLSVGQRRSKTGNPVQNPQGSQIGQAVQGLGDEWQELAEHYRQTKERQEAFDAELARRGFDRQIAQAEDEVTAKAPADGSGLHDAMYGQLDPRTGRVVKTGLFDTLFDNALPKMPDSQRAGFARQKEALRAAGSLRMAQRQIERRDEYERAEWAKVDNISTSAIAKSDPNDTASFEAIRQSGFDLIAKIGNPLARQAAEAAWRTNTAKARMEALIAKDPRRAVEILSAIPVASDGMAETVRAQLAAGAQDGRAAGKGDRIKKSPDRMVAQAFEERPTEANAKADADGSHQFIAGMTGEQIDELFRRASVAKTANMINTRADIEHATSNAPRELMYWGTYSGKLPGEGDFDHVFAAEEGARQRTASLEKSRSVVRHLSCCHYRTTHLKPSQLRLNPMRRMQPSRVARKILPPWRPSKFCRNDAILDGSFHWRIRTRPMHGMLGSIHTSGDSVALRRAVALSVAGQKQLHIAEILPFPQDVLRYINSRLNDPNASQKDKDALVDELSSATDDPAVQAAMFRQLYHFGLARLVHNTALELQMTPAEAQAVELEHAAKSGLRTKGQIWEYDPTLREKAGGFVAGEARPYGLRADLARALVGSTGLGNEGISAVDVAPVIGGVFSSQEALRALEAGHYGEAALDAVGAIPSGGLGGKVGKKLAEKVAEEIFTNAEKEAVLLGKSSHSTGVRPTEYIDPSLGSLPGESDGSVRYWTANDVVAKYPSVPRKSKRPFILDYFRGTPEYDPTTGKLLKDVDGDDLVAQFKAGRVTIGGVDKRLNREQILSAIKQIKPGVELKYYTKNEIEAFKAKNQIVWGAVERDPITREPVFVRVKPGLTRKEETLVLAHEFGHILDDHLKLSIKGYENELGRGYSETKLGRDDLDEVLTPVDKGYDPAQVPAELKAQGGGLAFFDPNYAKTVMPEFYAMLRRAIKNDEALRRIIQLNTVMLGAGGSAALGSQPSAGGSRVNPVEIWNKS